MIDKMIEKLFQEVDLESNGNVGLQAGLDELIQILKSRKLVIYPAGYMGQLLQASLAQYDIQIEMFIDRDVEKVLANDSIPIQNTEYLKRLEPDCLVIVATNLRSMFETLSKVVTRSQQNLTILNGFELTRLLKYPLCSERLERGEQLNLEECENCGFERHGCAICLNYLKKVAGAKKLDDDWRSESFDWFGYIVGQACTLKCIHCCEAIPMLKEHKFVPIDVILEDVRKVSGASRFLTFVELIGGEPFLHPDFSDLIRELLKIPNIGYIKSFTNGTVIPDENLCRTMRNPRFMLQVSNYEKQASGRLLDNIFETRRILKDQKVPYIFTQNFEWQDFSSFELHNVDEEALRHVFKACPLRNCNRLYKGRLFRCPHQYAGVELGKLTVNYPECVDINAYDMTGLSNALEAFEKIEYIDACRYCAMPFAAPTVPAGIQLDNSNIVK